MFRKISYSPPANDFDRLDRATLNCGALGGFMSLSIVFQSYQDKARVNMKGFGSEAQLRFENNVTFSGTRTTEPATHSQRH